MSFWCVVPAAGIGSRFGGGRPKQYATLAGRTVADHALERLLALSPQRLVVALHEKDRWWRDVPCARDPRVATTLGGRHRAESVQRALAALADRAAPDDWVLVHDIARPCVRPSDVRQLMTQLADDPVGGILAAPLSDTLKRVAVGGNILGTEDRSMLWAALTPQMFRYEVLERALAAAAGHSPPTDEAAAVEALGLTAKAVPGRRDNIKITLPEDLAVAEAILAFQRDEVRS